VNIGIAIIYKGTYRSILPWPAVPGLERPAADQRSTEVSLALGARDRFLTAASDVK
jgi:hypothetical protein